MSLNLDLTTSLSTVAAFFCRQLPHREREEEKTERRSRGSAGKHLGFGQEELCQRACLAPRHQACRVVSRRAEAYSFLVTQPLANQIRSRIWARGASLELHLQILNAQAGARIIIIATLSSGKCQFRVYHNCLFQSKVQSSSRSCTPLKKLTPH